jgi:hypothetical protein
MKKLIFFISKMALFLPYAMRLFSAAQIADLRELAHEAGTKHLVENHLWNCLRFTNLCLIGHPFRFKSFKFHFNETQILLRYIGGDACWNQHIKGFMTYPKLTKDQCIELANILYYYLRILNLRNPTFEFLFNEL